MAAGCVAAASSSAIARTAAVSSPASNSSAQLPLHCIPSAANVCCSRSNSGYGACALQKNQNTILFTIRGRRSSFSKLCCSASAACDTIGHRVALGPSANLASGVGHARQGKKFGGVLRQQWKTRVKEDDFDVDDEFDVLDIATVEDDEEQDFRDYEPEYEAPVGYGMVTKEADSFINTEGEIEETVVDWKINEDEFHKISLLTCDFFIRRVPDPDDNVYDFREMYVTPPDTDVYSIAKVHCKLPRKPIRCYWSNHEYIRTTEPPVDEPRAPLAKTEYDVMKVFLMRHFNDKRAKDRNFFLDFEEIYVIDTVTKSLSRADVQVDVPGGKNRDRLAETLIVRDDGTTFRIVPEGEERTPDEIVHTLHWDRTRENMENYLRGFRDYEVSNWF